MPEPFSACSMSCRRLTNLFSRAGVLICDSPVGELDAAAGGLVVFSAEVLVGSRHDGTMPPRGKMGASASQTTAFAGMVVCGFLPPPLLLAVGNGAGRRLAGGGLMVPALIMTASMDRPFMSWFRGGGATSDSLMSPACIVSRGSPVGVTTGRRSVPVPVVPVASASAEVLVETTRSPSSFVAVAILNTLSLSSSLFDTDDAKLG
mmetsp:Transcript_26140/g.58103  ORF Transcript_26140/g.58103 Transcript_26140/m.58103 type:complete len:205 (+) Transcript_26140:915-1529(+)